MSGLPMTSIDEAFNHPAGFEPPSLAVANEAKTGHSNDMAHVEALESEHSAAAKAAEAEAAKAAAKAAEAEAAKTAAAIAATKAAELKERLDAAVRKAEDSRRLANATVKDYLRYELLHFFQRTSIPKPCGMYVLKLN